MNAMRRFWIVSLLAIWMFASGCDLFSTREPEPPDSGRNTWITPREPSDVLDNMRAALLERDAVNYLRSFDNAQFVFEADPVVLGHDPSLAGWGFSEESQHIARLFSEGTLPLDSILSAIFILSDETILGDSAEIGARYELTAGVALSGVPRHMAGTANFSLHIGGDGYWQIHRWKDARTENEATWSDLKSLVR